MDTELYPEPGRPPVAHRGSHQPQWHRRDRSLERGAGPDRVAAQRFHHRRRPYRARLHLAPLAVALAGIGHTVATIEYRRVPGKPAYTIDDMRRALECLPITLRTRHDGRVILVGHSAGGHLVLWSASQAVVPGLAGVLGLAPVADLALALELNLGDGASQVFSPVEVS